MNRSEFLRQSGKMFCASVATLSLAKTALRGEEAVKPNPAEELSQVYASAFGPLRRISDHGAWHIRQRAARMG